MEDTQLFVEEINMEHNRQYLPLKPLPENPISFYLDVSKFVVKVGDKVKISKGSVFRAILLAQRFYCVHSHMRYNFPSICQAALVISLRTEGAEGTIKIMELYQNFGNDGPKILKQCEGIIHQTLYPHHIAVDDFESIISTLCETFSITFKNSVFRICEHYLEKTTFLLQENQDAKKLINHAINVVKGEYLMKGYTVKTLTVSTQTSPSRNPQEQIMKNYECQFCEKSFPTVQNRNRHEKGVHLSKENRCFTCNKKCKNLKKLQKHMTEKHNVIIQSAE